MTQELLIMMGALAAAVTAVVTLLTWAVRKLLKPLVDETKQLSRDMATLRGTPEERDASGHVIKKEVPSVAAFMLKYNDLDQSLEHIRHELTTNHGSSMKDAVRRNEAKVEQVNRVLSQHLEQSRHDSQLIQELHKQWVRLTRPHPNPNG